MDVDQVGTEPNIMVEQKYETASVLMETVLKGINDNIL